MKKIIAILCATTTLFFSLWMYEITDLSEREQLCQRYASQAAASFQNFEQSKQYNDEPLMGNYWAGVSEFYAFMDSLYILAEDDGNWNDSAYQNCKVIYEHMILAPDEVLDHMDALLDAMNTLDRDYSSSESWDALSELSYNFQYMWK